MGKARMMTERNDGDEAALAAMPEGAPHHRGGWGVDRLAISASTLCLIHCLFLPVLAAFLPALAQWADTGEAFHLVMLAIAVPLSSFALIRGWRQHRVVGPLLAGASGLLLLMFGVMLDHMLIGTILTVGGGITLALAHIANLHATNMRLLTAL